MSGTSAIQDLYSVHDEDDLGRGILGGIRYVCYAKDPKKCGQKLVVEKVKIKHRHARDTIQREINTLEDLRHINIMMFTDRFDTSDSMYMITEYYDGMNLGTYIEKHKPPRDVQMDVLRQIADGLAYAHSQGLAHRELKPANISAQAVQPYPLVKLAHFGTSKDLTTRLPVKCNTFAHVYKAPELCHKEWGYNQQVDMYVFGLLCLGMVQLDERNPCLKPSLDSTQGFHIGPWMYMIHQIDKTRYRCPEKILGLPQIQKTDDAETKAIKQVIIGTVKLSRDDRLSVTQVLEILA